MSIISNPLSAIVHLGDFLVYTTLAFVFLILMALISITLLLAIIKAWCVIYLGVAVLGLGAATWSQEVVINYFKSAISYGIKIFAIMMVISVVAEYIIIAFVTYIMSDKLPDVISGMVGGSLTSHSNFGQAAQIAKNITETAVKATKAFTPQGAALSVAETLAKKAGNMEAGKGLPFSNAGASSSGGDQKKSPAPKMRQVCNASGNRLNKPSER